MQDGNGARSRQPGIDALERMAWLQGLFYLPNGIWPILHIRSFEAITGPKTDRWLVKTVGALITVVGITLLGAARRQRMTPEMAVLGAGSAASLAAIDVVYVARRRISPIYLLDAVAEIGIIFGWLRALSTSK